MPWRAESCCWCPLPWKKALNSGYFRDECLSPYTNRNLGSIVQLLVQNSLWSASLNVGDSVPRTQPALTWSCTIYKISVLQAYQKKCGQTVPPVCRTGFQYLVCFVFENASAFDHIPHNLVGFSSARQGKMPARSWEGNWQRKNVLAFQRALHAFQTN